MCNFLNTPYPRFPCALYAGSIARDMSKNEGMELTMFVDADKNNLTFEFLERYDMGMEYIIRK